MPVRPEIFISAASRDLKSCRQLVRDALLTLGCVPVVQDHFPPGAGEVRAMLREKIAACQAVIHLAGECYGHEPQEHSPGESRRSYTQLEYDIARELGKPLYTFLCAPDFPYDAHEPEPAGLRALQDAHRAALVAGDALYIPLKNPHELDVRVRELQTRVETLSRDLQKTRGWLGRGLAAAVFALLLMAALLYGIKHQGEVGKAQSEARFAALQNQLEQQTKLIALVSEKIERHALAPSGPGRSDPAAAARDETAQQLGISADELQKRLASENGDVRSLLARIEQTRATVETEAARLKTIQRAALAKLGDAEKAAGHYAATVEPYRQALALTDKTAAPLDWCNAARDYEFALWLMGRYSEAEPLARELVETRANLQGKEDPDTLLSISRLAMALQYQGDYAGAETLYRRCLEARERTLGPDHAGTLASTNNLAIVLTDQGKNAEAETLFHRCVEGDERMLGKEHPDTIRSVLGLANVFAAEGKNAEAEALYRRCLEIDERTLGREHPDTLSAANNLAGVLRSQGNNAEAAAIHRRVLEARERTLGPDHPDTLGSVNNLANVLSAQGDKAGAEALYRRCLEARERTLGKDHPETLISAGNLAIVLPALGKRAEAEALRRRVLEARERTLGPDHPQTMESVFGLAGFLTLGGDFPGAEALYRRCLETRERTLGKDHPDTGEAAYYFSLVEQLQNKWRESLPPAEEALAAAKASLPPEHPARSTYEKNLEAIRARLPAAAAPSPGG